MPINVSPLMVDGRCHLKIQNGRLLLCWSRKTCVQNFWLGRILRQTSQLMLRISSPFDLLSRGGFRVGRRVRQARSLTALKRNTQYRLTGKVLHEGIGFGTLASNEWLCPVSS